MHPLLSHCRPPRSTLPTLSPNPFPQHTLLTHTLHAASPQATALHFADLRARYGDPLIVLNLLKSQERRPREMLLRQELSLAIQLLNSKVRARVLVRPV